MSYWAGSDDVHSFAKPLASGNDVCGGADVSRIVVADAHAIVRDGVTQILELESELRVIAASGHGQATVDLVRTLRPDLLLLDFHLPGVSGTDVVRQLSSITHTRIVLFTADLARHEAVAAIRLGVRGILSKDAPVGVLLQCIRRVLAGELWIERNLLAEAARVPAAQQESFDLSSRGQEIIAAIVSGDCNKQIAQKLDISDLTVKRHLTNIFNKVGVSGRLELALFALAHNVGGIREPLSTPVASGAAMRSSALPA